MAADVSLRDDDWRSRTVLSDPPRPTYRAPDREPVRREPTYRRLTVESGTPIAVEVRETISTRYTQAGERVSARLASDLLADNGRVAIRRGAAISGHVTEVRKNQRIGGRPALTVAFDRIELPDGSSADRAAWATRGKSQTPKDAATIGGAPSAAPSSTGSSTRATATSSAACSAPPREPRGETDYRRADRPRLGAVLRMHLRSPIKGESPQLARMTPSLTSTALVRPPAAAVAGGLCFRCSLASRFEPSFADSRNRSGLRTAALGADDDHLLEALTDQLEDGVAIGGSACRRSARSRAATSRSLAGSDRCGDDVVDERAGPPLSLRAAATWGGVRGVVLELLAHSLAVEQRSIDRPARSASTVSNRSPRPRGRRRSAVELALHLARQVGPVATHHLHAGGVDPTSSVGRRSASWRRLRRCACA